MWLMYAVAAVGLAIVVVLLVASRRPDRFHVQRSADIGAPPERVYPLIADLRAMNTWNPFVEPDPAIHIDYLGPASGKGATHTWKGNRNVGEGRLDVTDADPPSRVVMRLQMFKPFKADNQIVFTVEPHGQGSTVTWAMGGRQPLLAKAMTLFYDCDRMVGGRFEHGLAKLKAEAERA